MSLAWSDSTTNAVNNIFIIRLYQHKSTHMRPYKHLTFYKKHKTLLTHSAWIKWTVRIANVTGATSSLATYHIWNHWNAHSMVAIILSITSVKLHLSKEKGVMRLWRWNAVCITRNHNWGPQNHHRSMILKKSSTRLLLRIPRLQWPILLDIQMMMVKKLLVQMLPHQVTSRPMMVHVQHHQKLVGKI